MRHEWKSEASEGSSSKIAFNILNAKTNQAERSNSALDKAPDYSSSRIACNPRGIDHI
jgi:hypothetical protein